MAQSTDLQNAIRNAHRALRAGHYAIAITFFKQASLAEPGKFSPVRGVAVTHWKSGDRTTARQVIRDFLADQPLSAGAWRFAAQMEWKSSRTNDAIATLRRGLDHLPNACGLHRQLAIFLGASGQVSEAAGHMTEVHRRGHQVGDDALEQSIFAALGENARPGRMLSEVSQPTALPQEDPFDRLIVSPALLDAILQGLPAGELAETDRRMLLELEWKLGRLLEIQPHHADRQVALARVQMRLGFSTAAMLSLQRAVGRNPRLAAAHRLRAQLLCDLGEVDQAIDALKLLVTRGQGWADIHVEIARLEQQRGRDGEARIHLQSALRINPQYSNARQMLAAMARAA